jgi:hypothetical protein
MLMAAGEIALVVERESETMLHITWNAVDEPVLCPVSGLKVAGCHLPMGIDRDPGDPTWTTTTKSGWW